MMDNDKSIMIWSARLLSLFMLTVIIVIGILTYGLADSGGVQVKVDRDMDETFVVEKASLLASDWNYFDEQSEVINIPTGQNIFSYVSQVKEANLDFSMLGVKMAARMDGDTSVEMSVRVSADNVNWSGWQLMEMDQASGDEIKYVSENPLLFDQKSKYAQYKLILNSDVSGISPEIYNVELIYLNPEDDLALVKRGWGWVMDKVIGRESVDIISREEWGADESLMTWDEFEYAPVEQIIVHHTAGSDNEPSDPEAVMRGIYYFHAVEKDWGDIGYNYVIDYKGNIYEGRKGGLGVVGAHSSGNNYGSVGIAIIGNYSENSPSANALTALIDMVEYVGYQAGFDVATTHDFEGKQIPAVAGHQDVNSTECPGAVLESMLSDVAVAAKQGSASLPERIFSGSLEEEGLKSVKINSNETGYINIKYKNTGTAVWLNQTDSVILVPVDPYPRNSGFKAADWKNSQLVGPISKSTVMPGDTVNFKLNLKGLDTDGNYLEKFALKGPGGILDGTTVEIQIENKLVPKEVVVDDKNNQVNEETNNESVPPVVVPVEPKTEVPKVVPKDVQIDPAMYQGAWSAQSEHIVLSPGEEKTVWIDIKNTGKIPWYRDGEYPVRLGTSNPIDRHSGFAVDGGRWLADNRIEMVQWSVEPGELARFRFEMKGVSKAGTYKEFFQPVVEGVKWLDDQGIYIEVTVSESEYNAELIAMSDRLVQMDQGSKIRLWVELKNTGNVVWRKDGDYPVRLGTDDELDRKSEFYSPGFWIAANRPAAMKKTMIYPGDTAKFEIVMTAPSKSGVYHENFRPVVENMKWLDDLGIDWEIVVK